jgi:molybdopterin converting factor subunit 1
METIQINLLLFGAARELVGVDECQIEVPSPATIQSAYDAAKLQFKPLERFQDKLLIALNEEYMPRNTVVNGGDTLAIFPPVSGGSDEDSDLIEIVREPIDYNSIKKRLLRGRAGAAVSLDGVVRDNTKDRATRYLEYHAYEPMALKIMSQIAAEIHEKWPIDLVGMIHRLGRLEIGETSVLVMITSPHRKAAFEACQYGIDTLKRIVPIWKKEFFVDGEIWVDGQMPEEYR